MTDPKGFFIPSSGAGLAPVLLVQKAKEKNTEVSVRIVKGEMKIRIPIVLIACLLLNVGLARAIEIETGKMLGGRYDQRAFYVCSGRGEWRKTYTGPEYRPEAQGKLMNLRIAQGLFQDQYLAEVPFDPMANTKRLIAALDTYKRDGILAITVSLQGGDMHYNKSRIIKRRSSAELGPSKGALVSAFYPDGQLKRGWMDRLLLLQQALNQRNMVLNVTYFYVSQATILENSYAIDNAVRNMTDWLIGHNCRNVMIEIANEYDTFDSTPYIKTDMPHLIQIAREQFVKKKAAFRLPISASVLEWKNPEILWQNADLATIHGNFRTPEQKGKEVAKLSADRKIPGPIFMDEDDNGLEPTPQHLVKELAACDAVFQAGGSWGYMPWSQVQVFPFRDYDPAGNDYGSRNFRAVLNHIRQLVMRQ